jgi:histidinol-phosphate aminotransferase
VKENQGPRSVEDLIRSDVRELEEYVPVQPLARLTERIGLPIEQIIKLDANENPYGPSARALKALSQENHYHHYPDPSSADLRRSLAHYVGVGEEHILAGSGSDDLLEMILRLIIEPGDRVIDNVPTFGMYSTLTRWYRGEVLSVERRDDFGVDLKAIERAVDDRTKVIFVASPNNPTGNTAEERDICSLLDFGPLVVVDEAYYEFSGKTCVGRVIDHDNLVVLRTFSKVCGLAGLRVGYGVFPEPIIRQLWKIKQPYNVNVAAQVAAIASLQDVDYMRRNVDLIVGERGRLLCRLREMDFLRPYPSESNYVFCKILRGDASSIKDELESRGILIRYFNRPLLENGIRITVGTPAQNDALLKNLMEIGNG